jgi:hypothetical protein
MRFTIDRPGRTIVAAETPSTLRLIVPLGRGKRIARALARSAALLLAAWSGRAVPHA